MAARIATLFSATLLATALASCGGPSKKADDASDVDTSAEDENDDLMSQADALGEDDASDDGGDDSASDNESKPRPKRPKAVEQDYLISYRDCRALTKTYRRAWENGELKKLEGRRYNEKQLTTAQNNVRKAAEDAGANWFSACESIVDTPFLYTRLSCAMKAKTIKRFNDCWDGKVDTE